MNLIDKDVNRYGFVALAATIVILLIYGYETNPSLSYSYLSERTSWTAMAINSRTYYIPDRPDNVRDVTDQEAVCINDGLSADKYHPGPALSGDISKKLSTPTTPNEIRRVAESLGFVCSDKEDICTFTGEEYRVYKAINAGTDFVVYNGCIDYTHMPVKVYFSSQSTRQ